MPNLLFKDPPSPELSRVLSPEQSSHWHLQSAHLPGSFPAPHRHTSPGSNLTWSWSYLDFSSFSYYWQASQTNISLCWFSISLWHTCLLKSCSSAPPTSTPFHLWGYHWLHSPELGAFFWSSFVQPPKQPSFPGSGETMIPLPSSNPSLLYKLFFPCLLLGINNFPGTSSYHHLEALFPCVFRHSHVSRCPPPSLSPDFQHYLSSSWLETPLGYLSPTANSVAETFKIYCLPLQITFLSRFLCACQPGSSPQGPPKSSPCPGHISSLEWDWSLREGDRSQALTKLLRSCHPWVSLPTLPEVPIGMANLVLCCQASSLWKQVFHSPLTPDYPTIQAQSFVGAQ